MSTGAELDGQVCEHVERLWSEGDSRALAEDLLSGLKHNQSSPKGKLSEAWRLVTVWQANEPPCRATPLTAEHVMAMAGVAFHWNVPSIAAAILIGFHGILRSSEVGCATFAFFVLPMVSLIVIDTVFVTPSIF